MTLQEFDRQIARLETQWRAAYGQERKSILWNAFRDVPAIDLELAVSECLAYSRAVPLLDELSKAVDTAKSRRVSSEGVRGAGFADILATAAKKSKDADPDLVKACLKLFDDRYPDPRKLRNKPALTEDQFLEGCALLDSVADQLSPESRPRNPKTNRPTSMGYIGAGRIDHMEKDND